MIADYKKGNVFLTLLALGGGALILLAQEVSLFLVLFMVWIGMSLIGGILLVNSYSAKLMRLKGEEGWWAGPRDVIKVDLTVSREKGRLPVSKLWFLPAILISLGLLVWGQPTFALLGSCLDSSWCSWPWIRRTMLYGSLKQNCGQRLFMDFPLLQRISGVSLVQNVLGKEPMEQNW